MRFPRVSRIRWDKPTAEADRIEALERVKPWPRVSTTRRPLAWRVTGPLASISTRLIR
jgi:hypothetical protein